MMTHGLGKTLRSVRSSPSKLPPSKLQTLHSSGARTTCTSSSTPRHWMSDRMGAPADLQSSSSAPHAAAADGPKWLPHRRTAAGRASIARTPSASAHSPAPQGLTLHHWQLGTLSGGGGGGGGLLGVWGPALSLIPVLVSQSGQTGGCGDCVRVHHEHTVRTPCQALPYR